MTTSCVPVEITEKKLTSFMARLKHLIDTRDNRGKRHELVYVLGSVVLAIMSGRSYASSIQRFIKNRIEWLRRIPRLYHKTPNCLKKVSKYAGSSEKSSRAARKFWMLASRNTRIAKVRKLAKTWPWLLSLVLT